MATLLVISGGRSTTPAIAAARRLGMRVVVSDAAPDAPGFRVADDGLLASAGDVDATVEAARAYAARRAIDGVLAVAADVPVTVAAVADALGLPGPSLETARLLADRLALRTRLASAGIPVPRSAEVRSAAELRHACERWPHALALRPVDGRAGRGVVPLVDGIDLDWALDVAAAESPSRRVLVEAVIEGATVCTETIVVGGSTTTVAVVDREAAPAPRFAPFRVEEREALPSAVPVRARVGIEGLIARAAAALGFERGTLRGSVVVGTDGPVLVDLAARLSGGYVCTHDIPLATGIDLIGAAVRLAIGEVPSPSDLAPRWSRGVAEQSVFAAAGEVVRVVGAEDVAAGEGIALCELAVRPGDRLGPATHHRERAGVVIAVAETRGAAVARAEAAAARVRVITRVPAQP